MAEIVAHFLARRSLSRTEAFAGSRAEIQEIASDLIGRGRATVDSGRLSRFLRGERDITFDAAARLCEALGVRFLMPGDAATMSISANANAKP